MPKLSYINDEDLIAHLERLVSVAARAENLSDDDIYRNVIDPFSALIEVTVKGKKLSDWFDDERARQFQKSLQNAVGDFHQNVIGSIRGWKNAGVGGSYDVICEEKKIIADVKNKYNTMNSSSAVAVYDKLANHLDYGGLLTGYTAYLVEIIPKDPRPYVTPFTPSERGVRRTERNNLLKIDGKSFYELATGDPDAPSKLYDSLPELLSQLAGADPLSAATLNDLKNLFRRVYG